MTVSSNHLNDPISTKKKSFAQLSFLTRSYQGGGSTTQKRNRFFRRLTLRGNSKRRLLLQSPAEEVSAEFLKSGPLETPRGEFKMLDTAVAIREREPTDSSAMRLAPIEEQSFEEDAREAREDTSTPERANAGLICGCFETPFLVE